MPDLLPNFEAPPLTETVLGVEFAPLRWTVAHYGLFWSEVREEYPRQEAQPALESVVEHFGERRSSPRILIQFAHQPRVRCWFFDKTDARLLQIQPDRFLHNWRKRGDGDKYPRYERIRPIFEAEWQRFREFARRENLGDPSISQCEMTYVNQIERGAGWASLDDLDKVVTFWKRTAMGYLQSPEAVLSKMSFLIPGARARLHAELQHVVRMPDLREALQLTLTARGQPQSGSVEDVLAWMDQARTAIVRGFVDLTTPEMHKLWGRKA